MLCFVPEGTHSEEMGAPVRRTSRGGWCTSSAWSDPTGRWARYYDHRPMAPEAPARQSGARERQLARPRARRRSVAPAARLLPGALRPGRRGWTPVGSAQRRTRGQGRRALGGRHRHRGRRGRIGRRRVRDPREPVPEPGRADHAVGLAEPRGSRPGAARQPAGRNQHPDHEQHHEHAPSRRGGRGHAGPRRHGTVEHDEFGSRGRRRRTTTRVAEDRRRRRPAFPPPSTTTVEDPDPIPTTTRVRAPDQDQAPDQGRPTVRAAALDSGSSDGSGSGSGDD